MAETKSKTKEKVKALQKGLDEWTESGLFEADNFAEFMKFNAHFSKYSYMNRAMIFRAVPAATNVATYKKWQELGRQVNKGEKGIQIFCPSLYKPKDPEAEYEHDKDGNRIKNPDGTDKKKPVFPSYNLATVFDISQTSGKDTPNIEISGEDAAYETEGDLYEALRKADPDILQDSPERMLRQSVAEKFKDKLYADEMTEAAASIIAAYYSLDVPFNLGRCAEWAKGRKAKEIKSFMNDVIHVSNEVIGKLEE